jgi:hypothetical protein
LVDNGWANTPEEAALLGWADYPQANARIVRVESEGDDAARVIIETDPHHLEYSYCVRAADGRWREQISGGY